MRDAQRPGWPISTATVRAWGRREDSAGPQVPHGPLVRLRSLSRHDGVYWSRMRVDDEAALRPVEPTANDSWEAAHSSMQWRRTWSNLKSLARQGLVVPAAIEINGRFAGQLTLGNVQHGVVSSCWVGYWVHSPWWGQGVATAAVALGVDHAMTAMGLHRVEATVMEDNTASRHVLRKVGFREEGFLQRNLHINGQWQDHVLVGVTSEELFTSSHRGAVARLGLSPEKSVRASASGGWR